MKHARDRDDYERAQADERAQKIAEMRARRNDDRWEALIYITIGAFFYFFVGTVVSGLTGEIAGIAIASWGFICWMCAPRVPKGDE